MMRSSHKEQSEISVENNGPPAASARNDSQTSSSSTGGVDMMGETENLQFNKHMFVFLTCLIQFLISHPGGHVTILVETVAVILLLTVLNLSVLTGRKYVIPIGVSFGLLSVLQAVLNISLRLMISESF